MFSRRRVAVSIAALALVATAAPFPVTAAEPDIAIGSILPLTGSSAQTAAGLKAAQELAADLVNGHVSYPLVAVGKSGIPHLNHARIKLIFADSQAKPDQAKAAAEQLITQDHVVALIGCYTSSTTATASQVAERYGIPFINPDSANPTLHKRGFKWFFRTTPHDGTFSENFFQFFAELKRAGVKAVPKRVAIVHEDGLFGTGSADAEEAIAKQRGYEVAVRIPYAASTTDVSAEVQKIKAARPDVILITSYLPDSLLFMKAFKEQNLDVPVVAQDAGFIDPGFLKALGKDADFAFTREVFSLDIKQRNQSVPLIDQLFRQRFNNAPLDGNTARDFMGVLVLADALDRAGSTKPDAIRAALQKTDIPGKRTVMPWDAIKFDADGQNQSGRGIIEQVQGGKYETIWPADVAVKKFVWPVPPWSARK